MHITVNVFWISHADSQVAQAIARISYSLKEKQLGFQLWKLQGFFQKYKSNMVTVREMLQW